MLQFSRCGQNPYFRNVLEDMWHSIWGWRGEAIHFEDTLGTRTQSVDSQLLRRLKSAELSYHFNVAVFPVKVFGGKSNILLHYFPILGISPAGFSRGIFSKVQYHCLTHHLPWWPDILDTDLSTNIYVTQGHYLAIGLRHLRDRENTEVSTHINTPTPGSMRMASPELLVFFSIFARWMQMTFTWEISLSPILQWVIRQFGLFRSGSAASIRYWRHLHMAF